MPERKIIHVVFHRDTDRWHVLQVLDSGSVVLRRSKTKAAAIAYACKQGRSRRFVGQVVIHKQNGRIEHEWTYGADPAESKG